MASDPYCTLLQGDALSVLKTMPDESVDMCMTSPPYWGLRAYKTEGQIWDGKPGCVHEWQQCERAGISGGTASAKVKVGGLDNFQIVASSTYGFCQLCGAWQGELGLEPTFQLYIDHLMQIFGEVKRVLKKTGVVFVNIADSYAGGGRGNSDTPKQASNTGSNQLAPMVKCDVPAKSLIGIPERFALAMLENKWEMRQDITEAEKVMVFTELLKRGIIK